MNASQAPALTIGARPAPTPHTRPIPVNGSSADPALARRFGLGPSRYQGPTGIVGVMHEVLRKRGLGLISLFANVPHYLNVSENPPGTLALLRALEPVIGMPAPIGDLEDEGVRFIERATAIGLVKTQLTAMQLRQCSHQRQAKSRSLGARTA